MPHSGCLTALTRPGKRTLAAGAAVLLLAGGISAYLAQDAPAASAQTEMTGGLDASVNPGGVTVGLATVSATITYTCTSAPNGQAQLRVDFDQSGNDTSGEANVPCGANDIDQTQTITAAQVGMSSTQEITAVATLDDGNITASNTDDTVDANYLHGDPTVTFGPGGTINVTGYYNCTATGGNLFAGASQVLNGDGETADAVGYITNHPTCNGSDQPFSTTLTSNVNAFTPGIPVTVVLSMDAEYPGELYTGWGSDTEFTVFS